MDGGYTCALQGIGRQNKHCLNADSRWHRVTELLCLSLVVSTYQFWIELKDCRAGGVEHIKTVQYNIPHHQSDTALLCYPLSVQSSKLNIPRLLIHPRGGCLHQLVVH